MTECGGRYKHVDNPLVVEDVVVVERRRKDYLWTGLICAMRAHCILSPATMNALRQDYLDCWHRLCPISFPQINVLSSS